MNLGASWKAGGVEGGINPTTKGLMAIGAFISYASRKGWLICEPLSHDLPFDFLIGIRGAWRKVQVKSTYTSSKGYREVNFRRGRSKKRTAYLPGDFDLLFIFDAESQVRWLIPMGEVSGAKSCVIASAKRWERFKV